MARFLLWVVPGLAGLAALYVGLTTGMAQRAGSSDGVLHVEATPDGASVYVDDVFHGYAPTGLPVTIHRLMPGPHVVRVDAAGFRPERDVVVLGDGDVTASFALRPAPRGRLVLATSPSGARIRLDGQAAGLTPATRDVAPGRHVVEFVLADHNVETRLLDVPALPESPTATTAATANGGGENGTDDPAVERRGVVAEGPDAGALSLFVPLRSRQVEMFRRRIAERPRDIAAYSDFWIVLYDQDRLDEAAQVVVDGLYQAQRGEGSMDQGDQKGFNKLRSEMRNKEGRRRGDRWTRWIHALDRAIIRAVAENRASEVLMDQFVKNVDKNRWPEDYFEAMGVLAMDPKQPATTVGDFLAYAVEHKFDAKLAPFFQRILDVPALQLGPCAATLSALVAMRARTEDETGRERLDGLIARVRERGAALRRPDAPVFPDDRDWLSAEAEAAFQRGDFGAYRRWAEAAVDTSLASAVDANRRRVQLAERLIRRAAEHPGEAKFLRGKASDLIAYIVNLNATGDTSIPPARVMRDRLVAAGTPLEFGWASSWPLTDWQVTSARVPAGTAEPLAQAFAPDGKPFSLAGPDGAWLRVEWRPDEAVPTARLWADAKTDTETGGGGRVGYARTWIHSTRAREVELSVATTAPFRLHTLDKAVLVGRDTTADASAAPMTGRLTLRRGFTPVLMKWLSTPEGGSTTFTVTVRDPEGRPLDAMRHSAARQ